MHVDKRERERDAPIEVGDALDALALVAAAARRRLVDDDLHVRERRRELARQEPVYENVCAARLRASVTCSGGKGAREEEKEGTKEKGRRLTLKVRGDKDARSLPPKSDEVLDDAAEEACAVVGLGALAELVDDEERARREVAQREPVAGAEDDRQ